MQNALYCSPTPCAAEPKNDGVLCAEVPSLAIIKLIFIELGMHMVLAIRTPATKVLFKAYADRRITQSSNIV